MSKEWKACSVEGGMRGLIKSGVGHRDTKYCFHSTVYLENRNGTRCKRGSIQVSVIASRVATERRQNFYDLGSASRIAIAR